MAVNTASKRNHRNGIEAAKVPENASQSSPEISDLARQFLDLAAEERAAADQVLAIKFRDGQDAYDVATKASLKAQTATRRLAKVICEQPIRDMSNVIEKALVAREYCPRWKDGTAIDLTLSGLDLIASGNVVLGVLSLAGLDDVPVRRQTNWLAPDTIPDDAIAERQARRRGEDPDDRWRFDQAEYEVIKIDALSKLIWKLADSFEDSEQETLQYISNRLSDHVTDLQTTLFADARELAKKGLL